MCIRDSICIYVSSPLLSSSTRRRCYPQRPLGQAVITGAVPFPRGTCLHFVAHRVQHSHCSSIFMREESPYEYVHSVKIEPAKFVDTAPTGQHDELDYTDQGYTVSALKYLDHLGGSRSYRSSVRGVVGFNLLIGWFVGWLVLIGWFVGWLVLIGWFWCYGWFLVWLVSFCSICWLVLTGYNSC